MKGSFVVPRLFSLFGVFLISAGIGLRSIKACFPFIGIFVGVLFFLLAGYVSRVLVKKEEQNSKEN